MCRENVSLLNGLAFALLIASCLACALSFTAPFWIYYPDRHGVPHILENFDIISPQYPFKRASWRGLWAVCYKDVDLYALMPGQHSTDTPDACRWFWQQDYAAWKTVPDWYLAAEGIFAGAMVLAIFALVFESLYACCHCCLRRSCAPTLVGSLAMASALMVTTSLALFGGFSFKEKEFTPEPNGFAGRLDWAFYVGIGSSAGSFIAAILFLIDGCRLAKIYSHYKQPTVTHT